MVDVEQDSERITGMIQGTARLREWVLSAIILFLASQSGWCLEPPSREQLEQYKRDGTLGARIAQAQSYGNHRVPTRIVKRTSQKLANLIRQSQGVPATLDTTAQTPPLGLAGLPTTGNVKVLTLLIEFNDILHNSSNTQSAVSDKIFGAGTGGVFPYESLKNFYQRSSYNQLTISGNALGWYKTAYNRSSVVQTTTGRENLIKEALNSFKAAGHDFSQYDNDGDGYVDYFAVIWTGPAGAWASFWWGYKTDFVDSSYMLDGKRFGIYSWQWESNPSGGIFQPNVLIHETGHALGVPDYYDYNDAVGPRGGVGGLDQMDSNWGDHNCWSKFMLDWLTPTVYSGGTNTATLRAANANKDAALFIKGATGSEFGEFFMVQNRQRDNNDPTDYPADGLLIWHVDSRLNGSGTNYIYDNSYTSHKLLRLMEADGLEQIEQRLGVDAGDYYTSGKTFSPTSWPDSFKYDASSSMMGVDTISAAGASMTCRIFELGSDATPPTGAPSTPTDEGAVSTDETLRFDWTVGTAADAQSGLGSYQLQVGTSPGSNDVFDGLVGPFLTKTVTNGRDGETHYARVRVRNGGGLFSAWSGNSNGIVVNLPWFSCTAVDNCALSWKTAGDLAWSEQGSVVYHGGSAGVSGAITHSQKTQVQTTLIGPGNLSFYWKVSSESNWDFLSFSIDGVLQTRISGEVDWTKKTYAIAAGKHILRWEYAKDTSVSTGSDSGYLDWVVWDGAGASAGYYTVTPCRVFDTRVNSGDTAGYPALAAGERRVFPVATKCGIPTSAKVIVANLTVVGATQTGDLQVTASTLASTTTTILTIPLTRARANNATVQLATDGTGGIAVKNVSTGIVEVVLDVVGYLQ